MSTRAEEIAAKEYPDLFIRDDKMKTSGTALISDAAQMLRREGFINGYKQGQQDRWISVEERLPNRFDTVLTYGKLHIVICWFADGIWRHHESEKENKHEVTHWMPLPPSPPNPEQR